MPKISMVVSATNYIEAADEAIRAIARTLSDPLPPESDFTAEVKLRYTILRSEERAKDRYLVELWGTVTDILSYKQKQKLEV